MVQYIIAKAEGVIPLTKDHSVEVLVSEDHKKTQTRLRVPAGGGAYRTTNFNCPEALVAYGEELVRMGKECVAKARPILDQYAEENRHVA